MLKRRKPKKSGIKRNTDRVNSPGHLKYVRGYECCIANGDCYGRIEAHHVKTRGSGGGDEQAVPLCTRHHGQVHNLGHETFEVRHKINLTKTAADLWRRDVYHRRKWESAQ